MIDRAPVPRPAVAGAFFALVAALAGIAAHGVAEGAPVAPSFDALFLLTSGVLAIGAVCGLGASRIAAWAGSRPGAWPAWLRSTALMRGAGVLVPVTAGQWFSHLVLVGDHEVRAVRAGGVAALGHEHVHGLAAVGAAGAAGVAGADPAATAAAGVSAATQAATSASGSVSAASASASASAAAGAHPVAWLPMLAAHAIGVLVCLVLLALLDRVLDVVADRVLSAPRRLPAPPRAPRARRRPASVRVCAPRAAAAPRAPPQVISA